MEIRHTKTHNAAILAVQGRMDATSAPIFDQQMAQVLADGTTYCIVNCSQLEYISSAGLRSTLTAAKAIRSQGGDLVFVGLQGAVHEVFEIAGFSTMFQVFASEEAALETRPNRQP